MQNSGRNEPTISGSPLSPAELARLKVLGEIPPAPKDFDPSGLWTHTYRIVTSHGYVESGNSNRGYLTVERKPGVLKGSFRLNIEQKVLQADGWAHAQVAEIRCALNPVATPIEWTLASRFLDRDGSEPPELTLEENGRLPDYDASPGATPKRTGEPPALVTADWCLFEAIQRLPFSASAGRRFDLLEGLSLARRAQRIVYRGKDSAIQGLGPTHRFQQTGSGMLPYDYWLDERHRLILAVTFSRAYVLDEKALSVFQESASKSRAGLLRRGEDG